MIGGHQTLCFHFGLPFLPDGLAVKPETSFSAQSLPARISNYCRLDSSCEMKVRIVDVEGTGFSNDAEKPSSLSEVSVVVPVVPSHDAFIEKLISDLCSDDSLIDMVVIARSELPNKAVASYKVWLNLISRRLKPNFKIVLSSDPEQRLAGENRNRGWAVVQTDWTSFQDADDHYSKLRLPTLLDVGKMHHANLVCHDYWTEADVKSELPLGEDLERRSIISSEEIYAQTFPGGVRMRNLEGSSLGDTNLVVPRSPVGFWPVTHGHLLVRTSVRSTLQFSQLERGQDGQFCRDVLWDLGGVVYVPQKLSTYNISRSTMTASGYSKLKAFVRFLAKTSW